METNSATSKNNIDNGVTLNNLEIVGSIFRREWTFGKGMGRGHDALPELDIGPKDVEISDLPWHNMTAKSWETLLEIYAYNNFRCPIKGCENKYVLNRESRMKKLGDQRDYPKPVGSYMGFESDKGGFFSGIGVVTGLGTGWDPATVKIGGHTLLHTGCVFICTEG